MPHSVRSETHRSPLGSAECNDLTEAERQDIIDLFQQYTYRRTLRTLFSDGSLCGIGDEIINIFVYEDSFTFWCDMVAKC